MRDETIAYLAADPASAGLVMDFDGVLSPIVADPARSRLLDGTAEVLSALSRRLGLVALLSGRPLEFLRHRACVEGVRLFGSYGLEETRDGEISTHPAIAAWLPAIRRARAELHGHFDAVSGVTVEEKAISVAVHWRRAERQSEAGALVAKTMDRLANSTGLVAERGKLVIELIPPIREDKGTAMRRMIDTHALARVAYAGDDLGDVPALRLVTGAGGHALVVTHGPETPSPVLASATRTFDGVDAFAAWLKELSTALGQPAA